MSQQEPMDVVCPCCAAAWVEPLFRSIDADTIERQVAAILGGSFERQICPRCSHVFQPEHPMLFTSHMRGLWIVMQPIVDRREFAELERAVTRRIADQLAAAPPAAERLREIRPRLVFGQHMLTEAVRTAALGLDAALIECAKLLSVRQNLPALITHGPFELCFERPIGPSLHCGVHTLPGGERIAEHVIEGVALAEAEANRAELAERFPDLFTQPYVSATRYLMADTL